MIHITTSTNAAGLTICVDGDITGEYVDVVENFVKQASARRGTIRLHLRDVAAIDERGRLLLERVAAMGVRLRAQGVYWSYVVAELNRRHDVPRVA